MSQRRLVYLGVGTMFMAACAQGTPGFESISTTSSMTTTMSMSTTGSSTESSSTSTSTDTTGTTTDTSAGTGTDTDTTTGGEVIDLDAPKARIYQLTVRLFSNTNTTNQADADKATNGVGKFDQIDDTALAELRAMGFSHIWLHGVIQQATLTDNGMNEGPDDPDAVKGKAGNLMTIRDYYDVCPDYATSVANRMMEFEALVDRIHAHDMKVVIDFVPNHVARTYHTTTALKKDFGLADDRTVFHGPTNSYFYLVEPPDQVLMLPTPDWWTPPGMVDGTIDAENSDGAPINDNPRATGNDVTSPTPAATDWYDTVKLNYGYDFIAKMGAGSSSHPTWKTMDDILSFWQAKGVDGFRVDNAHRVPLDYWAWQIDQARKRDADAFFVADAREDGTEAMGVTLAGLVDSGFDAIADATSYDLVKKLFCCTGEANALTAHLEANEAIADKLLRFSEQHDQRRIASTVTNSDSANSGFGTPTAGKPVSALLFLLSKGPLQVFNGQEVGEPADDAEGFGQDDGRTTLYDYWSMPELAKWVNDHAYDGGGLSPNQQALRSFYRTLNETATLPAIAEGGFISLQDTNKGGDTYCSKGRWCYSFIRYTMDGTQALLMAINMNPQNTYKAFVIVPQDVLDTVGLGGATKVILTDRLDAATELTVDVAKLTTTGVQIPLSPSQTRILTMKAG